MFAPASWVNLACSVRAVTGERFRGSEADGAPVRGWISTRWRRHHEGQSHGGGSNLLLAEEFDLRQLRKPCRNRASASRASPFHSDFLNSSSRLQFHSI